MGGNTQGRNPGIFYDICGAYVNEEGRGRRRDDEETRRNYGKTKGGDERRIECV
jgi:hypothetical protein